MELFRPSRYEGEMNKYTGTYNNYDGQIGIELRGQSSLGFEKKGYGLETRLANGENNNVSGSIMNELSPPRDENAQGIVRGKPGVQSTVSSALRSVSSGFGPVTGNQKAQVSLAEEKLKMSLDRINKFLGETWPEYKSFIGTSALSPFTDKAFKPLKW